MKSSGLSPTASPSSATSRSYSPSTSSLHHRTPASPLSTSAAVQQLELQQHGKVLIDEHNSNQQQSTLELNRSATALDQFPTSESFMTQTLPLPSSSSSKSLNNNATLDQPLKHLPASVQGGRVLPGAHYALAILILMNLLNYADRFVPSACKSLIQNDLHLSDTQTALPMGAFLLVYMICAPVFGYLADSGVPRVPLIAFGLGCWSIATVCGAFANSFMQFLLARAAVGVGEAAYATIAPALLCDYFPASQRPRILSLFYLAIPCGAALGYAVAGQVGSAYGWRDAFLVCGIPGLLLVLFVLAMNEPKRGGQDQDMKLTRVLADGSEEDLDESEVSWEDTFASLSHNPMFLYALLAVTLVSFASGGLADWLPTWLQRVQHISNGEAGIIFGVITCVAGVSGSLLGYVFGEGMGERGIRNPYFVLGAVTQFLTCLFSALLLGFGGVVSLPLTICIISLCQFCMWLNCGGCSAMIANSVHPAMRSRAFGISILISHLGGDAISPSMIGWISDENNGNLTIGFYVVPVAFGIAAIVFALAARNVREEDGHRKVSVVEGVLSSANESARRQATAFSSPFSSPPPVISRFQRIPNLT